MMIGTYLQQINALIPIHQSVSGINPALRELYPVVVVEGDQLLIYDHRPGQVYYGFIKSIPTPMPVPRGLRAAFQLEAYEERIACVVTPDVFNTLTGYVTILHEFVHCYQYETCEQELKLKLDVARQAQEKGDVMWEIQHPFPYQAEAFRCAYTRFIDAISRGDTVKLLQARTDLRSYLGVHDFEYMVWQEWKEGFARWVENRLQQVMGLPENKGGLASPFSRLTFYAGGAAYIDFLMNQGPDLAQDLVQLFFYMVKPVRPNPCWYSRINITPES